MQKTLLVLLVLFMPAVVFAADSGRLSAPDRAEAKVLMTADRAEGNADMTNTGLGDLDDYYIKDDLNLVNFWRLTELDIPEAKAPVGVDYFDGALFVSSMGASGHGELDGYIIRHDLHSGQNTLLLQNQVNSPKSLLAFNDKLIFIDPYIDTPSGLPSVVLADLKTNKIIATVALEKGFPRDIETIDDWHNFVVTDSELNKLYLITLNDDNRLTMQTWAEGIVKAQGLAHFQDGVFVAGQGPDAENPAENTGLIYRLNDYKPQSAVYYAVSTPSKNVNSVAFHTHYMFVSDWAGKHQETATIYVVDIQFLVPVAEIVDMPPPSDMVFVENTLYMTAMTTNKVVGINIDFNALDEHRFYALGKFKEQLMAESMK